MKTYRKWIKKRPQTQRQVSQLPRIRTDSSYTVNDISTRTFKMNIRNKNDTIRFNIINFSTGTYA